MVAIAVIGSSCHNIVLSLILIEHPQSLIATYVKLNLLLLQYAVYHLPVFLDDVILYSVVIEHVEICGINGHFHFVDETAVVQIDGLHGSGVDLILQKQVSLGNCLTSQIVEEGTAAGMLADHINHSQAYQEDCGRGTSVLQGQGCSYFHSLSDRIKPTPGLV